MEHPNPDKMQPIIKQAVDAIDKRNALKLSLMTKFSNIYKTYEKLILLLVGSLITGLGFVIKYLFFS